MEEKMHLHVQHAQYMLYILS